MKRIALIGVISLLVLSLSVGTAFAAVCAGPVCDASMMKVMAIQHSWDIQGQQLAPHCPMKAEPTVRASATAEQRPEPAPATAVVAPAPVPETAEIAPFGPGIRPALGPPLRAPVLRL